MEHILSLFPDLTDLQQKQLETIGELYPELNQQVNVISRKDIEHIFEHHILHALLIGKYMNFVPNAEVLDLGTGGGFPGVPLAIMFPQTHFTLVDGTRKKIGVVKEIIEQAGIKNVRAQHIRAEDIKTHKFDFVTCRAVASIDKLVNWSRRLLKTKEQHAIPNGLLAWKGGDVEKELQLLGKKEYTEIYPLGPLVPEELAEYYEEKYIIYVQR